MAGHHVVQQGGALLQLSYALNYAQAALEPQSITFPNLLIHFFSIGAALWMSFRMAVLSKHHSPHGLQRSPRLLGASPDDHRVRHLHDRPF